MRRAVWLCLSVAACNQGLDEVTLVTDLRVLAVRADPPEVLDGFGTDQVVGGGFPVRFSALVVDPRGSPIDTSWRFCAVQSSRACHDHDERLAEGFAAIDGLAAAGGEMGIDPAFVEANVSEAGMRAYYDGTSDCAGACDFDVSLSVREPSLNGFSLPRSTDVHLFHMLSSPVQFLGGAWPSAILQVRAGGQTLEVMKRINVTLQNPAAALLLSSTGFRFCQEGESGNCLALAGRKPNENPLFDHIEMAQGELATTDFSPVEPPLYVRAGEAVRILPVFKEGSNEPYEVIGIDMQTREAFVEQEREEVSVSWYATSGSLQDALTWPLYTRTLDTVYTAPEAPPESGTVTIWMVARDQRGGVAWESLELTITP